MTFVSRQSAREGLKTGLATALTATLAASYDYVPNSLEGQSPVMTVSSWSSGLGLEASAHDNTIYLLVGFWALRVNKEGDLDYSAAAEDEIDTLADGFKEYMETWNNGELSRPSVTDYVILDGEQYRTEAFFVTVEHWEG